MQPTSSSYSIVQKWDTAHLTKAPFYGLGYRERLHEIWHLLTLARPGYIFDKIAGGKKRVALKILDIARARIFRSSFLVSGERDKLFTWEKVVPPARVTLPAEVRQLAPCPSFRSPLPSFWDECTTSCKRSAEFCKDRSEKLVRPGRDHINRASTSHLTKLP